MQAASMDHFCRCCRKLIGKKDKFYLKLFGKKAIAKGNLKPFESMEKLTCKKKKRQWSSFDLNMPVLL